MFEKLKNSKVINIIKWVWLAVVLVAAVFYVKNNFSDVKDYFSTIHWVRFPISILFLLCAKLILANVSRFSVENEGWQAGYWKMLSLYSITQLGKYLPGGVWHFVGRFGAYRSEEFDTKKSLKAMIAENFWLISSAMMMGIVFLLLFNGESLEYIGLSLSSSLRSGLAGLTIVLWLVAIVLVQRFYAGVGVIQWKRLLILVLSLIAAWLLIGFSYAMMFPVIEPRVVGLAIGGFTLSWSVGYLAIFAPGGIGVRELMLSLFFSSTAYAALSPVLATVHRMVWIVTEVLLGSFCMVADSIRKKEAESASTPPAPEG